ncbi:MAG: ABC transporter permease subunit [Lachnospiraceae bacterium]|nr:ABC transporter permease subunit [Lachnospiraceae bacterium]
MKKHRRIKISKNDSSLIRLSLPTLIWYIAFCYIPMFGILLAFKRYRLIPGKGFFYSLIMGSDWVGLSNFRYLFLNPQIGRVVRNTLGYNLVFLILGTLVPLSLALMLSFLHSKRTRSTVEIVMMLPYFLSWIIVSYFVFAFLSSDRGLINSIAGHFGAAKINYYQEPAVWPIVLTIAQLWKTSGYTMLLYYANIISIEPQLYDMAAVDGANVWQTIRHVILPHLSKVIIVMILLAIGHILSTDFGLFYQVPRNSGSIISATETIDVFVYKALMENSNYGFSAAAGLIQNVIGCILLFTADRLIKKVDPDGGVI